MSITSTQFLCPTEEPSFFPFFSQQPACIIPSYSFFFLSHYDTVLHIAVIIIFCLGCHTFFLLLFKIISSFIFYNSLNSIHKLIYDRQKKDNTYTMTKYLLFSFLFFMPFFFLLLELSCFSSFPFLFSGGLVSTVVFPLFLFFFLEVPHFVFLIFGFFFLFLFFWGHCVVSLSFHRLNKPFEIDS